MTVVITRHGSPTNADLVRAREVQSDLAMFIDSLEDMPQSIGLAFGTALLAMQTNCWVDQDAEYFETCESFAIAMQLGTAMFAISGIDDGPVESLISQKSRLLSRIGPNSFANVDNWLNSFYLAVICRDQARMAKLCDIPSGSLRSSSVADEFLFLWMDVLQIFWLQRDGLFQKLKCSIESSYAEVVKVAPEGLLQTVLYPPINLFYSLVFKSEDSFNAALKDAIELHKVYWTSDVDRLVDVAGSVALAPLAIACIAYDMEIPVRVESSYMPRHLLTGNWLDGFPI
ncbi:immunity 49 family protein [Nocardia sp. NPDC059228]|uniref:immunity 49 family protein n=1 Tax=Nocardia sp. NPDC059228 TaxID=3346777 RepID=UPI0036CA1839